MLTYEVPINRVHCTGGPLGIANCQDTGESVTMVIKVDTRVGSPDVPDGLQKGVTEATDAQREFAADVLRDLLRHIDDQNGKGHDPFLASPSWTDGPMMYLVYTAPPF